MNPWRTMVEFWGWLLLPVIALVAGGVTVKLVSWLTLLVGG